MSRNTAGRITAIIARQGDVPINRLNSVIESLMQVFDERIAELEQALLRSKANYFDLNSEFQQCLDCCKRVGELEAEDEWKQKQIVSQRKRIAELEYALWVCIEHNRLHFGESHNTVIQGKQAMIGKEIEK